MISCPQNSSVPARRRLCWPACWPLFVIGILYLGLVIYRLNRQDPDKDETITSEVARLPAVAEVVENRLRNGHPPLYFLATRAWAGTWGLSYPAIVWLSALFGLCTLPLVVLLGRELGLGRWSWVAGLILSVQPTMIYFARYSRPWAGVILIMTAILWLSLRVLRRPSWHYGGLLVLAGLLGAAWSHALLIVWGGLIVAILTQGAARRRARRFFWLPAAFAILTHAYFLLLCKLFLGPTRPLGWIEPLTLRKYFEIGLELLGGRNMNSSTINWQWLLPLASLIALASAGVALFAPGRAAARQRSTLLSAGQDYDWLVAAWRLIAIVTIFPWILLSVVSWTIQPIMIYRYMMLILPGLVLLMAWAMARLVPRRLGMGLLGLLVIVAVISDYWQIRRRPSGLGRCIARLEKEYQADGQDIVVVFSGHAREALQLLARRPLKCCLAWTGLPHKEAWATFKSETQFCRRIWVLQVWDTGSILHTSEWSLRAGQKFFEKKYNRVRLYGYLLPEIKAATGQAIAPEAARSANENPKES